MGRLNCGHGAKARGASPEADLLFSSIRAVGNFHPTMNTSALHIGDWKFDPTSFELVRDTEVRRLPRKLGELLARLALSPGQVLSRESLIADVWDGRATDDVLSRAVAELRRALDDDPRTPRYIETLPKVGYRCVATVAAVTQAPTIDAPTQASIPAHRRWGRMAAALVIVLLSATLAWTWRRAPAPAPANTGARVLLSTRALDAQRLLDERPLTSAPGWELAPAFSPDGHFIAYARTATSNQYHDVRSELVVRALDSANERVYAEPPGINTGPVFSPDGTRLAFVHLEPDGRCELRLRPVFGDPSNPIAECAHDTLSNPAWTADGLNLIYTAPAQAEHSSGLARIDLASRDITPLTRPDAKQGPDLHPRSVPGQAAVSFVRGRGSDRALMQVDLDGKSPPRLLFGERHLIQGHAWSADGTQLVVATDWPGFRALVQVDPATGATSLLGARGARWPAAGTQGQWAYEIATYDANIHRIELAGERRGQSTRTIGGTRYDASPTLSPDGQWLAYGSTREDYETIWLTPTTEGPERRLPLPEGRRWVRPAWSPDSRSLLLTSYEDDLTRIHVHDLASARTHALDALGTGVFAAQYAAQGTRIVFGRRRGESLDLYVTPTDLSTPPKAIAHATDVDEFRVADDCVAFVRAAQDGLYWANLADGSVRNLVPELTNANRYNWTLRNGRVYYVGVRDGHSMLMRYDPRDASHTILIPLEPTAVAPTLSVSPDESYLMVATLDELRVDLHWVPPP
jgi:Tol biopolymer transport system component/DNA-binding winged helix-turn-helix (wHTH) protein